METLISPNADLAWNEETKLTSGPFGLIGFVSQFPASPKGRVELVTNPIEQEQYFDDLTPDRGLVAAESIKGFAINVAEA